MPPPRVPASAKPLTLPLILGKLANKALRHHAPFLQALTHLHMSDKGLSTVAVVDPKDPDGKRPLLSGQCPNLKIIYLENNHLVEMAAAFNGLKGLV